MLIAAPTVSNQLMTCSERGQELSSYGPRMSPPPPPKRRNAPQTRLRILAAAQQAFSRTGYSQTGIRDIAAIADVNSALLLRYFGSKSALFEAALIDAMRLDEVFAGDRAQLGTRLMHAFLDRRLEIQPPALIGLSLGDPAARDIAARVTLERVIRPMARWLGPPDAHARSLEIFMLAMGFVAYSRQLPVISANRSSEKKVAGWFADTVQQIVDRR
jgi:AcrR family transcriptional regulator